jgi:hypothetical protein
VQLNISENKISMWSYTEVKREKLVVTATLKNSKHIEGALWHGVKLPSAFCIIDFLFVRTGAAPLMIGVQITASTDPFNAHDTDEACSDVSKARLRALVDRVKAQIQGSGEVSMQYLMLAPNCAEGNHVPPAGQNSNFLFSPPEMAMPASARKRREV